MSLAWLPRETSHSLSHTLSLSLSLFISHSLSDCLPLSHSPSPPLSFSDCLPLSHSLTLPLSLSHCMSLSLTHTRAAGGADGVAGVAAARDHSLSFSLFPSLAPSIFLPRPPPLPLPLSLSPTKLARRVHPITPLPSQPSSLSLKCWQPVWWALKCKRFLQVGRTVSLAWLPRETTHSLAAMLKEDQVCHSHSHPHCPSLSLSRCDAEG